MSYILPVTHYQYNDYQRRTIQKQGNKHFIERPFKVILEKEHQEISTKYDAMNRGSIQQSNTKRTDEELFGELTGKGMHFSDRV
ncbi:hypothetical protein [Oceanobacillus polygoni]|uniref:Uncharacterized protein n=1 Tax=Oceanobacillus polygoni TaxID=1235259 RepID=A0A9X1CB46_9BACI|nr:hypothetical protein [Oceanobacillus polygoni]MBP2076571.1 hypothetical protein [Oceanobacillus polygoni]